MTALPPSSDYTSGSITQGQKKTFMAAVRTFLADLLGTDSSNKVAAQAALGVVLNSKTDKGGAYTVVAGDKGKVINATTGTWTLSLTAAATLGDGFAFAVQNSGAGTITIDPNASETIDGATTKTVAAGKFVLVYCDGAKFTTIGGVSSGSGSGLDADLLDGQHGSYYATASHTHSDYVDNNVGNNGVGSIRLGRPSSGSIAAGSTISGGSLAGVVWTGTAFEVGAAASGSWRNISSVTVAAGHVGTFQRIS